MASGARPGSLVPPPINESGIPSFVYPDDPQIETCHIVGTHDIFTAIRFSMYIIFGIVYTFLGYRIFKITMFLTGFIFASSILYLICLQEELLPAYGNAGVALLAGVLFGLITMLIQYVGLFMTGLHTGLLLGLGGLLIADHFIETHPRGSVWLCIVVLLSSALFFAIFNLHFRKSLTILGTAVYGGALSSAAIDYFIEKLSLASWIWQRVSLKPVLPPPCWYSWIILATWPSFVLTGLLFQCTVSGRGLHHEDSRKKQRGHTVRALSRAMRAEMRQKKYRYLYQVRTAHGDVISQNFVQAIQKKDVLDGHCECSTLQSDATNLTILPDVHLAVLSESEDDSQASR